MGVTPREAPRTVREASSLAPARASTTARSDSERAPQSLAQADWRSRSAAFVVLALGGAQPIEVPGSEAESLAFRLAGDEPSLIRTVIEPDVPPLRARHDEPVPDGAALVTDADGPVGLLRVE